MHLEDIQSPRDLKSLNVEQLNQIGKELRARIIKQVSEKGGHLAPSLGVIELTVALHYVYNTPVDKLIWDVGHQAYAHKLLTGRQADFHTLRQHGGLSGFLKRTESEYDAFGAGHASTSISAGLGMAVARDLNNEAHSVVAIIGDGSLTGGMAFEAINNAAAVKENMTIVLNDNKMSIAPNVGSLSKYLNRIISDPTYNKIRGEVLQMMGRFSVKDRFQKILGQIEGTAKRVLTPGTLFEDLGLKYFGPVDGHNLNELIAMFKAVKEIPGPCLVHVLTEKGHGWEKAVADSYKWHASVPFDRESGEPLKAPAPAPALTKVFADAFIEIAKDNRRVVAITAAMPNGTGLNIVEKALPEQVFDVGIAEQHAVTFAAGLACGNIIPVCAIYSTFLQRAIDQVIHDVALQKLHVVFVLDRGGLVGADGPTHHGTFDITYMRMVPNMVVMAPSDQNELRDMLYTAVHYKKGPVALRFPRGNASGEIRPGFEKIAVGIPRIVDNGSDVLLLCLGHMLEEGQKAAQILKNEGINCTLVDARFAKPLNKETYQNLIEKHSVIITLEDNALAGGYGSGVSELMVELDLFQGRKLKIVALPDRFVDHGDVPLLYKELGMDGASVAKLAKEALSANKNGVSRVQETVSK